MLDQHSSCHEDRQTLCERAGPIGLPKPQHISHLELPLERDQEPAECKEVPKGLQRLQVGVERWIEHLSGWMDGSSSMRGVLEIILLKYLQAGTCDDTLFIAFLYRYTPNAPKGEEISDMMLFNGYSMRSRLLPASHYKAL